VDIVHRGIPRDGKSWSWYGVRADAWHLKETLAAQGVPCATAAAAQRAG
jgi:hypothetical protein